MGWLCRFWPAIAVFVLLAAIASDFFIARFWVSHPMLTAVLSAMADCLYSRSTSADPCRPPAANSKTAGGSDYVARIFIVRVPTHNLTPATAWTPGPF